VDQLSRDELDEHPRHRECLTFREQEGTTLVIRREEAETAGLRHAFASRLITLTVHSSLEAVGLTSAFSAALSNESISCNVVAAFHHDHIFVNKNDAEKAVDILNRLSH